MKIAIVAEIFPPFVIGGAEISSKYLAEALAKENDVLVVTPNYGRRTELEKSGRLIIHRFGFPSIFRRGQIPNSLMGSPLLAFTLYFKMRNIIRRFNPDVIHAQNSLTFFPVSLFHSVKKVATLRDYASLCDCGFCSLNRSFEQHNIMKYMKMKYRWQSSIRKLPLYPLDYIILKMKQHALRHMDGVVCVSNYVKGVYNEFLGKSAIIHNIGKFEVVKKNTKKEFHGKVVLYVGKISMGKGTKYFIETIKIVSQYRKDVTFVIAGDGPMKDDIIELSKEYKNVKCLGKVSHERVLKLYSMADVVCSTSYSSESLSRVQIEALSLGVPCIATDVGGAREVIEDGVSGFLTEPGNSKQMAEKIEILLSNKTLRDKFSRNGMVWVKKEFNEKDIVEKHMKFYGELVS